MFRSLELPERVSGYLYLHSMPGRYESFQDARDEIARCKIERVIRLASLEEVRSKSQDYALAIEAGQLPWLEEVFPVPDFDAPKGEDLPRFLELARNVANHLINGKNILIHCGAGIGRTGTLAICILIVLGMRTEKAKSVVKDAESEPEMESQKKAITWVAQHAMKSGT